MTPMNNHVQGRLLGFKRILVHFIWGAFRPILISVDATPSSILQDKTMCIDNGGDHESVNGPLLDPFDHITSNYWWNPGYWWLDCQLQPGIDML